MNECVRVNLGFVYCILVNRTAYGTVSYFVKRNLFRECECKEIRLTNHT